MLELNLAHEPHAFERQLQPLGAKRNLRGAFLTGNVKRRNAERNKARHHLNQKRRLADAGVAADQGDAASDEAAAHHAVEFREPRDNARRLLDIDLGEILHGARRIDEAARGSGIAPVNRIA